MNDLYKYIKGETIYSSERMLTSKEITEKYGISLIGEDKEALYILIDDVIKDYKETCSNTTKDFYYIKKKNYFLKVYPMNLYESAMSYFFKKNNLKPRKNKLQKITFKNKSYDIKYTGVRDNVVYLNKEVNNG